MLPQRPQPHLRLRVLPHLGAFALSELTTARIEDWWGELLRAGVSSRQAVGTLATILAVLTAAVRWGFLSQNAAARLRAPAEAEDGPEQVERVS